MSASNPESETTATNTNALDALEVCIDVYKHHFELWLKGYVVYLAIIGALTGLIFGKEADAASRDFLLLFMVTVSVMAVSAWAGGLVWVFRFSNSLDALTEDAGIPQLPTFVFKWVVFLGLLGSVVITIGAVVLLGG